MLTTLLGGAGSAGIAVLCIASENERTSINDTGDVRQSWFGSLVDGSRLFAWARGVMEHCSTAFRLKNAGRRRDRDFLKRRKRSSAMGPAGSEWLPVDSCRGRGPFSAALVQRLGRCQTWRTDRHARRDVTFCCTRPSKERGGAGGGGGVWTKFDCYYGRSPSA